MSNISITPAALDPDTSARFVALSRNTMERLEQRGEFPRRRVLSGRRVAYLTKELQAWVESRPVSDLSPPENSGYGRAGKQQGAAA